MDEMKSIEYQLINMGYCIGASVKRRKADTSDTCQMYTIVALDKVMATLAPTGIHADSSGKAMIEVPSHALSKMWATTNAKPQKHVDLQGVCPEQSYDWEIIYVKSQIWLSLNCLSEEASLKSDYSKLDVYESPWTVVALDKFDKGEL
eukprot:329643-Pyramimonas_sp.AAC.1